MDAIGTALGALSRGSYAGLPLAAIAGVTTSIGPCMAPRYLALATITDGRRPFVPLAFFVSGLLVAFTSLGFGAGVIMTLVSHATTIYALLATALLAYGLATLVREPHACREPLRSEWSTQSGAFLLGAGSALVLSPCCTPIVVGIVGLGLADRKPAEAVAYLATFAVAHVLPLVFVNTGGAMVSRYLREWSASGASAIVTGALTIALGCYYGLLA
jgi:cytochrome c biogenesis protein CcdA